MGGQFSHQQLQLARQLFSAPQVRQAGPKVRLALAETPLVESWLSLDPRENSEGSAGPLQQAPKDGWGTLAQVDNPRHAAESFLKRAIPIAGKYGTAGQLAQAVQRSAYPERYDQHKGEALELLKELGGNLGSGTPEGGRTVAPAQLGVSTMSSAGSTQGLQEVLAQVKALSGPTVVAAQAQPARPAFSAGPTLPEGSKAPAPIQPKSQSSSLLPLLEHALSAAQTPNVESKVTSTPRAAGVGTAQTAVPQKGLTAAKGLTDFGGKQVAAWIAPALHYAQAHGWKGSVSSGYRSKAEQERIYNSGVRPAAVPGTSNHEGTAFPRGAVDVTEAQQLSAILQRSPYAKLLVYAGSKDPVHFSNPHNGSY